MDRYRPADVGVLPRDTTFARDGDRQPTTTDSPDGRITSTYDDAGRLVGTSYPGEAITYGLDGVGRPTSVSSTGGVGLVAEVDGSLPTRIARTGLLPAVVDLTYDGGGRLVGQAVSGGPVVGLTYDAAGRLSAAGAAAIRRDGAGRLIERTVGSVVETVSRDNRGEPGVRRVTSAGSLVLEQRYERDKLGRVSRLTEVAPAGTRVTGYAYDGSGRLAQVTVDGATVATYSYDANGNRLLRAAATGNVSATYDGQDRMLTSGPTTYVYTAGGRLRTRTAGGGTTTYSYDAVGNLRSVDRPDGTRVDYVIDGRDRRVAKKRDGAIVQGFVHHGARVVAELDGTGAVVSRFVYDEAHAPAYMVKGGRTYRLVSDHLGSPRVVVDVASGAVAQRLDYDELGRVVTDTSPGFQPFGFAGGLYDPDTGLVRFGARDYDPQTGRWTAKDPILFAGGTPNLYSYAYGDPVNLIDPRGTDPTGPDAGTGPAPRNADAGDIAGAIVSFPPLAPLIGPLTDLAKRHPIALGILAVLSSPERAPTGCATRRSSPYRASASAP